VLAASAEHRQTTMSRYLVLSLHRPRQVAGRARSYCRARLSGRERSACSGSILASMRNRAHGRSGSSGARFTGLYTTIVARSSTIFVCAPRGPDRRSICAKRAFWQRTLDAVGAVTSALTIVTDCCY